MKQKPVLHRVREKVIGFATDFRHEMLFVQYDTIAKIDSLQ